MRYPKDTMMYCLGIVCAFLLFEVHRVFIHLFSHIIGKLSQGICSFPNLKILFCVLYHGVSWPSGSVHRICVLMAESSECGFKSWLQPWYLCPWARHFTIIASLHPAVNGYLWGQSWLLCLISPICAVMAVIELYTRQGAEMDSGKIYAPDEQG